MALCMSLRKIKFVFCFFMDFESIKKLRFICPQDSAQALVLDLNSSLDLSKTIDPNMI